MFLCGSIYQIEYFTGIRHSNAFFLCFHHIFEGRNERFPHESLALAF